MSKAASILDAKLTYLYSRTGGNVVKFGLDATLALLRAVGVDPLRLPCIHVAGTNGKGSVSAMLESVLREAGLRTALYTSPHLIRFNERIRVLGQPIPEFTCVAGTTVQEAYETSAPIREAAERSVRSGFEHVRPHLAEALAAHPVPGMTAEGLAAQFQVAVQGGIILAKALNSPAPAREGFDHLERYLRLLFGRPATTS